MTPQELQSIIQLVNAYSRSKHKRVAAHASYFQDGRWNVCFRPTEGSSLSDDGYFVTISANEMESMRKTQSLTPAVIKLLDEELIP